MKGGVQADDPANRTGVLPDLGNLLGWLIERAGEHENCYK